VAAPTLVYEPVASSSTFDMRLLLRFLLPVGLLVLVALGSYAVYANWSALKSLVSTEKVETSSLSPVAPAEAPIEAQASSPVPAPEPAPVSPAPTPAASEPTGTSPASAAPTPEAAAPAAGQTLVISAVSRCWISYAVDEEKGVERTLQKGDTLALAFKDKLRVIFGNVGGVRLTHNGKDLEKISKSGKYTLTLPKPE
jgi:cytoskeletal protein RodZ